MMNITARAMSDLDWAIRKSAESLTSLDPDSKERKDLGWRVKCAREAYEEIRQLRKEIAQGAKP